jgi:hypothetical protein
VAELEVVAGKIAALMPLLKPLYGASVSALTA